MTTAEASDTPPPQFPSYTVSLKLLFPGESSWRTVKYYGVHSPSVHDDGRISLYWRHDVPGPNCGRQVHFNAITIISAEIAQEGALDVFEAEIKDRYFPDLKINAIKHIREVKGIMLKEAKAEMDALWLKWGYIPSTHSPEE